MSTPSRKFGTEVRDEEPVLCTRESSMEDRLPRSCSVEF